MNFKQAVNWLYGLQKYGMKLGLERITHIAAELDNPHKNYKTIHVGGTNGKGSVCKFLESILVRNGYTVGVYTSPHLQHISERIVVNNKEITENELVSLVKKIKPITDEMMKKNNNPTFFEVFTAIAFEYFKEKKVDFAIIEVGLGGRFDATNIVKPEVSIITNISSEHQDVLGKKIKDIAFEKAGIIKENTPLVTAAKDEALRVIEKIAKEKKTHIEKISELNWKRTNIDGLNQEFLIKGILRSYSVTTSLIGRYQGENIAIAISTVEILQNNGYIISKNSIINGIKNTVNPGRMEVVSSRPCVLLDGAHNIAGMKVLIETLENDFQFEGLIVVLGILSDKNIEEMLPFILPVSDFIITTKSSNKRACNPKKLKDIIEDLGYKKEIFVKDQIINAIDHAKSIAKKNDLICITGSLFTVGEARDYLVSNLQKC